MGKYVPSWLNVAPSHVDVLWHDWHVVGKCAAAWFGLVVALYSGVWQEAQRVDLPWYTPSPWQPEHNVETCAPVSRNWVALWSNAARAHCVVVWHEAHAEASKPAARCAGCAVV